MYIEELYEKCFNNINSIPLSFIKEHKNIADICDAISSLSVLDTNILFDILLKDFQEIHTKNCEENAELRQENNDLKRYHSVETILNSKERFRKMINRQQFLELVDYSFACSIFLCIKPKPQFHNMDAYGAMFSEQYGQFKEIFANNILFIPYNSDEKQISNIINKEEEECEKEEKLTLQEKEQKINVKNPFLSRIINYFKNKENLK